MYTCKIIMCTCIVNYVDMQDNYVYMQDNYLYIITQYFFTQVKIYVVQWKKYVVMSLQGHRNTSHRVLIQISWNLQKKSHRGKKLEFFLLVALTKFFLFGCIDQIRPSGGRKMAPSRGSISLVEFSFKFHTIFRNIHLVETRVFHFGRIGQISVLLMSQNGCVTLLEVISHE